MIILLIGSVLLLNPIQPTHDDLPEKIIGKWSIANIMYETTSKDGKRVVYRSTSSNKIEFKANGIGEISYSKKTETFKWSVDKQKLRIEYTGESKFYQRWNKEFLITLKEVNETKSLKLSSKEDTINLFL